MSSSFDYITQVLDRAVEDAQPIEVKGRVIQVVGTIIKASVPGVKVGEVCILRNPWENFEVQAEVVGFTREAALLTALGALWQLAQTLLFVHEAQRVPAVVVDVRQQPFESTLGAAARQRSSTSRTSFTPDVTAESVKNEDCVCSAIMRARVVFPTPGGPQRMKEAMLPDSIMRRITAPSPTRCFWPI